MNRKFTLALLVLFITFLISGKAQADIINAENANSSTCTGDFLTSVSCSGTQFFPSWDGGTATGAIPVYQIDPFIQDIQSKGYYSNRYRFTNETLAGNYTLFKEIPINSIFTGVSLSSYNPSGTEYPFQVMESQLYSGLNFDEDGPVIYSGDELGPFQPTDAPYQVSTTTLNYLCSVDDGNGYCGLKLLYPTDHNTGAIGFISVSYILPTITNTDNSMSSTSVLIDWTIPSMLAGWAIALGSFFIFVWLIRKNK